MRKPQTTPCLAPKMCVHIPSPRELPAGLRRPRPNVRHGEVVAPIVAKRRVGHVEESLPHALECAGIVIVEGRCHGVDDVLQIPPRLDDLQ